MGDPFRVFKEGTSRQETLKVIWPELYECLAGIGKYAGPPRTLHCVIGECGSTGVKRTTPRRVAVARLTEDGHPACAEHIAELARRPGGWPLARAKST